MRPEERDIGELLRATTPGQMAAALEALAAAPVDAAATAVEESIGDELLKRLLQAAYGPSSQALDGLSRRAIFVGLGEFGDPARWAPLPKAKSQIDAVVASFQQLGYTCAVLDDSLPAEILGMAIRSAIRESDPSDVLVIHVLSHGTITPSGALRVVGADGQDSDMTEVDRWIRYVVDAEDKAPRVLFLLDICFAGGAARLDWQRHLNYANTRAWVIAACGPAERAFGGRFTEGVTQVNLAIANGELDIDSSYQHAPITTVAQQIRRNVSRAATAADLLSQQVTASVVDISTTPVDLPFFPNTRYEENPRRIAGVAVDAALRPFLDDLDEALDPIHFLGRASGHGPVDTDAVTGCFSGRGRELRILSPWLNLQDDIGLRVVTGSPGVGKSALIGVLVCAAHPQLRAPTEAVWHDIEQAPYRNNSFAAVHARKRGLTQVVSSIAHQLTGQSGTGMATADLVALIARFPHPPVLVVDALDEAVDGEAIMRELLLPLTATTCLDGRTVRLMVGVRPWTQFEPLLQAARQAGGLVDLDDVSPGRLRDDLTRYVSSLLLADQRWRKAEHVGAAYSLAHAVADKLTDGSARQEWGAFLVAGLFTSHLISSYPEPLTDTTRALTLGATVPRSLPELLDLDLRTRGLGDEIRNVLTALAHARGEGMPAEVLRHVASGPVEMTDLLAALDSVRFYLRHGADPDDGTTLYRLFHQGLADHLGSVIQHSTVLDRMLHAVDRPAGSTTPLWNMAVPYLRRHIADHAQQADRLDEVLGDVTFLAVADPSAIGRAVDGGTLSPAVQSVVDSYRAWIIGAETGNLTARRFAIALGLMRSGAKALVGAVVQMTGADPLPLRPMWRRSDPDGKHTVAVAISPTASGTAAFVGAADGRLAVVDFETGNRRRPFAGRHSSSVTAVGIGQAGGSLVLISADHDRQVLLHDAASGRLIETAVRLPSTVSHFNVQEISGRATVLAVDFTGRGLLVDLKSGYQWGQGVGQSLIPESVSVGDVEMWLNRSGPTTVEVMRKDARGRVLRHDVAISAASIGGLGSTPIVYTGDVRGELRAWSASTGEILASANFGSGVLGVSGDVHGNVLVKCDGELFGLRLDLAAGRPDANDPCRRIVTFAHRDASGHIGWLSPIPPRTTPTRTNDSETIPQEPAETRSPTAPPSAGRDLFQRTTPPSKQCFCGSGNKYQECHGTAPPT